MLPPGSHRPVRARIRAYGSSGSGLLRAASVIDPWLGKRKPFLQTLELLPKQTAFTIATGEPFTPHTSHFVDTSSFLRLLSICRVSRQRSLIPTSRFPPPGPLRLCVPRLQRYYQDAMTPWSPSRFTSFPSIGDTIAAHDLDFALEAIVCVPCIEPGTCSPGNSVLGSADGEIRASQVPGEPHLLVCTYSRDPGRTGVPDHSRNVRAAPAS